MRIITTLSPPSWLRCYDDRECRNLRLKCGDVSFCYFSFLMKNFVLFGAQRYKKIPFCADKRKKKFRFQSLNNYPTAPSERSAVYPCG